MDPNDILNIKKTIIFLGEPDDVEVGSDRINATGFLVSINQIYHIITAKHIVINRNNRINKKLVAYFNSKEGGVIKRLILEKRNDDLKIEWMFHEDKSVDVAIIPFSYVNESDDLLHMDEKLFINSQKLTELTDIIYLSYQPGIPIIEKITPIFRTGVISLVNHEKKIIYIDGFAFPGNSGSPVFIKPSPYYHDGKSWVIKHNPLSLGFIGVIGEFIPYEDIAISIQTKRPRITFEENTGIAKVWSMDYIQEIIESKTFQQQMENIRKKIEQD